MREEEALRRLPPHAFMSHYRCLQCGPDTRWREGGKTTAHQHLIVFHRLGYVLPDMYEIRPLLEKSVTYDER